MINQATAVTLQAPPRTFKVPTEARGAKDYPVDGWDLIQFGASPLRWVKTPRPADDEKVCFSEAVRLLHLTPEHVNTHYAVCPETYTALVLTCPKCESVGPAKHCRACNLARRHVTTERPWSAQAKHCLEWTEARIKRAQRIIPHDLHQRATQATQALQADPEVSTLLKESQVQAAVRQQFRKVRHRSPLG